MKRVTPAARPISTVAAAMAVILAGCTPGTSVSEPAAFPETACRDAVRSELRADFGGGSPRFDRTYREPLSRGRERVSGEGEVWDRGERTPFSFRCVVHRASGRVEDLDLAVDRGPDGADAERARRGCRQAVEERVSEEAGRDVRLDFGRADVRDAGRKRVEVSGGADVRRGRDRGRVDYRCTFNPARDRVAALDLDWNPRLPDAGGQAESLCHRAIEARSGRDFSRVRFLSTRTEAASRNTRRVEGEAEFRSGNRWYEGSYRCRVDERRGEVTQADYRFDQAAPPAPPHGGGSAEKACREAVLGELYRGAFGAGDDGVSFHLLEYAPGPAVNTGPGRQRVDGRVRTRENMVPRTYRFSCTLEARSGEVIETRLDRE